MSWAVPILPTRSLNTDCESKSNTGPIERREESGEEVAGDEPGKQGRWGPMGGEEQKFKRDG